MEPEMISHSQDLTYPPSHLFAWLQTEFADNAGILLDLEEAPLRPRSVKLGRTTSVEVEKRMKSAKETTKKEAKASTARVVQAAIDGKDGRNRGGAGKGKHPCAYCKQVGHKWTRGGKLSCPQAIVDAKEDQKRKEAQVLEKAQRKEQAEQRDMARRREDQNE